MVIGMCTYAATVPAQNQAFSDSGTSVVEYWLTPHESQAECAGLVALSGREFKVVSAVEGVLDDTDITYCKVDGIIQPEIQFQVNLPARWNGRTYMHGNGGNGGLPADHPRRWGISVNALKKGFVVVYSNSGHDATTEPGISFALNDPMKELDYAYRATRLSQVAAARIAAVYYKRDHDFAYFDGCSWGGHQGFAMAQRYPDLFDGILAGSPVFNFTGEHIGLRQLFGALDGDWPGQKDTDAIAAAILAKCDGLDDLEDGVLLNPRACEFDPVVDMPECDPDDASVHCIGPAMREKLATVYQPVVVGDKILAPGRPVSSELKGYQEARSRGPGEYVIRDGWSGSLAVDDPGARPFMLGRLDDAVKVYLFEDDMTRTWKDFDVERDWVAVKQNAHHLDETNPDLRSLQASNGKLLAYHGWADFNINPNLTYEYFEAVHRVMGEEAAEETVRLFMVPGMFHCRGGNDVFEFDGMTPLINWVERGEAPERIIFSGNSDYHPDRERPVCAFPTVATYTGGDPESPLSFECTEKNLGSE
jgi:feruloyl esterase